MALNVVFEGLSDRYILEAILKATHVEEYLPRDLGGKHNIIKNLPKYNSAVSIPYATPWLVVLDMDNDSNCVVNYVRELVPNKHPKLLLRISVRALEAWIMADRENFARFINVSVANIPQNPDVEDNPKQTLLNLVRRSRKTSLKDDMLPRPGAKIGVGYVNQIRDFVNHPEFPWRPEVAAENSESLARCIKALKNLAK